MRINDATVLPTTIHSPDRLFESLSLFIQIRLKLCDYEISLDVCFKVKLRLMLPFTIIILCGYNFSSWRITTQELSKKVSVDADILSKIKHTFPRNILKILYRTLSLRYLNYYGLVFQLELHHHLTEAY